MPARDASGPAIRRDQEEAGMYLENNQVKRYPLTIVTAWFLVILWMAVIFALSHQTQEESSQYSRGIAERLLELTEPGYGEAALVQTEQMVRDAGHAVLYLILALLVSWAFDTLNIMDFRNALLTLIICALYAASDELHQAFVPGRSSEFRDFLIDLIGIFAGILVYQAAAIYRYFRSDLQVDRDESLRL